MNLKVYWLDNKKPNFDTMMHPSAKIFILTYDLSNLNIQENERIHT